MPFNNSKSRKGVIKGSALDKDILIETFKVAGLSLRNLQQKGTPLHIFSGFIREPSTEFQQLQVQFKSNTFLAEGITYVYQLCETKF